MKLTTHCGRGVSIENAAAVWAAAAKGRRIGASSHRHDCPRVAPGIDPTVPRACGCWNPTLLQSKQNAYSLIVRFTWGAPVSRISRSTEPPPISSSRPRNEQYTGRPERCALGDSRRRGVGSASSSCAAADPSLSAVETQEPQGVINSTTLAKVRRYVHGSPSSGFPQSPTAWSGTAGAALCFLSGSRLCGIASPVCLSSQCQIVRRKATRSIAVRTVRDQRRRGGRCRESL
jgi:hypothetical protein